MTSNGGDNGGFKGLFGSLAKAIGGAFVEGLERQMQEHLVSELSNPNLAARNATAKRLRAALARKEFAFSPEVAAKLDAMVMQALASANAKELVKDLATAVRNSGWKPMQRLLFYQLIAPHPNVNIGGVGPGPNPTSGAAAPQNLPPKPPPADRPDYLKVVPMSEPVSNDSNNTNDSNDTGQAGTDEAAAAPPAQAPTASPPEDDPGTR